MGWEISIPRYSASSSMASRARDFHAHGDGGDDGSQSARRSSPVASCGETRKEERKDGHSVTVVRFFFTCSPPKDHPPLARTWTWTLRLWLELGTCRMLTGHGRSPRYHIAHTMPISLRTQVEKRE